MKNKKQIFFDFISIVLSGALYGFAFIFFIEPAKISPGGASGIAAIVHYLISKVPTGVVILVINMPLFLSGFKKFGKGFIVKSFFATLSMSFFIDLFEKILPRYNGERIISSLFAGVLVGVSLSIVLLRGYTTGGMDIAVKLIIRKKPFLPFGRIMLMFDGVIVLLASIVYRDVETALYSIIMLFASSKVIDRLIYGAEKGKLLLVITDKSKQLSQNIMRKSGRGVTVVPAFGGYTKNQKDLLFCASRIQEVSKIRNVIKETDENAFIIIAEVGEILGYGFKNI